MHLVSSPVGALAAAATCAPAALAYDVRTATVERTATGLLVAAHWPAIDRHYTHAVEVGLLSPGAFLACQTARGGWIWQLGTITADGLSPAHQVEALDAMGRHAASLGIRQIAYSGDLVGLDDALAQADTDVTILVCPEPGAAAA